MALGGRVPRTKSIHKKQSHTQQVWPNAPVLGAVIAFSSREGALSPIRITTVLAHEEDTVGLPLYLEAVVTPPNSKDP